MTRCPDCRPARRWSSAGPFALPTVAAPGSERPRAARTRLRGRRSTPDWDGFVGSTSSVRASRQPKPVLPARVQHSFRRDQRRSRLQYCRAAGTRLGRVHLRNILVPVRRWGTALGPRLFSERTTRAAVGRVSSTFPPGGISPSTQSSSSASSRPRRVRVSVQSGTEFSSGHSPSSRVGDNSCSATTARHGQRSLHYSPRWRFRHGSTSHVHSHSRATGI